LVGDGFAGEDCFGAVGVDQPGHRRRAVRILTAAAVEALDD
jgi:hypothetical protein